MPDSNPANQTHPADDSATYTVVARRYRPKSFQELVGQEHIAQALGKAIATGRVGHAYLFTGARGVGKTSSARIFAKALNAPGGPTSEAVATSDVTQAIDSGEDVDVIEIDAASNRGIDEIRQLRANVSVRPSRSRYKIYIIDEVHMLTPQAFNALLKTLEEPPEHVKFIFCTTDPEKVPITVLSRCQRFDFAPVSPDAIKQRLAEICQAEGFEAEDDALALIARRAAGSMRDSQSLLEQVMSFSSGAITADQVHALLGTADETRLRELAEALVNRDGVMALKIVDKAINEGTDAGQFAEQMLGYLRDLMAVAVGGGADLLKVCNPTGFDALKQLADRWGLQTILAAVQLLDESLVRMRVSVQSQALFEVALIQISQLQDLAIVAKVIEAIQQGGPLPAVSPARVANPASAAPAATAPGEKKNVEGLDLSGLRTARQVASPPVGQPPVTKPAAQPVGTNSRQTNVPASTAPTSPQTLQDSSTSVSIASNSGQPGSNAPQASGPRAVAPAPTIQIQSAPLVSVIVGEKAVASDTAPVSSALPATPQALAALEHWKQAASASEGMLADFAGRAVAVEIAGPSEWTVVFPPGSGKTVDYCDSPTRKEAMQAALAPLVGQTIKIGFRVQPGQAVRTTTEVPLSPTVARSQRLRQLAEHPMVSKLCELLQGEVVRVDPPADSVIGPPHQASADSAASHSGATSQDVVHVG